MALPTDDNICENWTKCPNCGNDNMNTIETVTREYQMPSPARGFSVLYGARCKKCGAVWHGKPMIKDKEKPPSLRTLASDIKRVAMQHPYYGQAVTIIQVMEDHLCALARIAEINQAESNQTIEFDYVNWIGERERRKILPISIRYGTSEWYTEPQWLLAAWDLNKQTRREFAIAKMRNVKQQDQVR